MVIGADVGLSGAAGTASGTLSCKSEFAREKQRAPRFVRYGAFSLTIFAGKPASPGDRGNHWRRGLSGMARYR